jgi:predicted transcriptional regulator
MKMSGNLSRREQQIMDLVYERGTIVAGELEAALPGQPSNSAVRAHLRTLEAKGLLSHTEEQGRFVYRPTKPQEAVARGELSRLLTSFFGGSVTAVVSTLLDQERERLSEDDVAELRKMIDRAEEGR